MKQSQMVNLHYEMSSQLKIHILFVNQSQNTCFFGCTLYFGCTHFSCKLLYVMSPSEKALWSCDQTKCTIVQCLSLQTVKSYAWVPSQVITAKPWIENIMHPRSCSKIIHRLCHEMGILLFNLPIMSWAVYQTMNL